jgi:hypothetical protein
MVKDTVVAVSDDRQTGPMCCTPPSLWGWSPPPLPTESAMARRVDRFLPRTGLPCLFFLLAVVALLNLAPHLPARGQLGVEGIAFAAAGGWCALNFWRCRQAHCLISGFGWLALSVLTFIETGIGHSVIGGNEEPAFLGVLAIALVFEGAWYLAHRTNAVGPEKPTPSLDPET